MSIAWKKFSATFSGTSQVKAGLLYKVNGPKTSYIHRDYNISSRVVRLDNLKPGTTYDVFLGSVEQNKTFLPGPFVQLQLKTDIADRVPTPFCTEYYNFTIFPNVFGDKNEADAIFRLHTFFPLFDTMCSKHLKAFICSAFLPPYDSLSKGPQKPCSSFCSHVFDRCRYAIERLKFKWPDELNCENLLLNENMPCFSKYLYSSGCLFCMFVSLFVYLFVYLFVLCSVRNFKYKCFLPNHLRLNGVHNKIIQI